MTARATAAWAQARPDYALIALTAILGITGLVAVYSASFVVGLAQFGDPYHYVMRQAAWAILGLGLLVAAARIDYRRYQPFVVPIMFTTLLALAAVLVIGQSGGGARRWIGVGELTVQPAEFAKLTVTIYLAAWLQSKRPDSLRSFENGLVPFVLIIGAVGVFIMLQPSLGTTLVILVITVTMFWVAGASILQMFALFCAGSFAIGLLALIEGYRAERLTAFLHAESDPEGNGFQTLQSLIAMGNGGVDGLGLGASRAKFFYIPESHTDGVFAIIGEELGIVGAAAILLLYVIFMIRGYQVARRAPDDFGRLIATGITTWITIQALLNIGGITRVTPLTGVPLPFLSFGGNALAAVMLGTGVLMNISRQARQAEAPAAGPPPAHPGRRIVRRQR